MALETFKHSIGDVEITQVVETDISDNLLALLPEVAKDAEEVKKIEWLDKPFRDDDYKLLAISQCFFVKKGDRFFVVDTCVGNEKTIPAVPNWNNMQLDFLEILEAEGIDRFAVTDVLCTHLHMDHVGWNTYKKDGEWMPTFPNAKYHFAKEEYHYWESESQNDAFHEPQLAVFQESIKPIVDAGLVNFIDVNDDLGDGISVISTPGHTKAHVSIVFETSDNKFIIGGDMAHHPVQIARPDWAIVVDYDGKQSSETRRKIFGEIADTKTLYAGTHFCLPAFGHVTKDDEGNFVFNAIDK